MYKVFLENKYLGFQKGNALVPTPLTNYMPQLQLSEFHAFEQCIKESDNQLIIKSKKPKETKNNFFKNFKSITAAGGLVYNPEQNSFLFIHRNGFWDLPKGKVEENEKKREAALREVEEECGISNLILQEKLTVTEHVYYAYGHFWIKKTHWYYMTSDFNGELIPQSTEGITKATWITRDKVQKILPEAYSLIREVFQKRKI
jgi:8-oxo-dGTP pyrophosphatase MutT (NUDIX family)